MSQKTQVLNRLKKYGCITPIQALRLYGVFRLADVVYKLRNEGHNIKTTMIINPNGNQYARYTYHGRR